MSDLPLPKLDHACDLHVELVAIRHMGAARTGDRRIIQIVGGTVTGPLLQGKILNLGADWQVVHANGIAELEARYAFETPDGALIEILNEGYRHGPAAVMQALARGEDVPPEAYYMRTFARLETGDPRYAWVNGTMFLGTGARRAKGVVISLFAVR